MSQFSSYSLPMPAQVFGATERTQKVQHDSPKARAGEEDHDGDEHPPQKTAADRPNIANSPARTVAGINWLLA